MAGRKITVFLIDGMATGLRTAELGLATIKALVIPRASLAAAKSRDEVQRTGVYILVGKDSEVPGRFKIYIGEADSVITRLAAHDKDADKEFWEDAIVFVSKDEYVTKAHGRYLESRMIALAQEARQCTVANVKKPPGENKLPKADRVEMEEFIEQAQILLRTLGYSLFSPVQNTWVPADHHGTQTLAAFAYSGDGFSAVLAVDSLAGTYVVRKDSTARLTEAAGMSESYHNLRAELVGSGVLIRTDECFRFAQDYVFSSVTAAAQVVGGTSISGRTAWRLKDEGTTYADWQDNQLP